jgi:uncharacterized protein
MHLKKTWILIAAVLLVLAVMIFLTLRFTQNNLPKPAGFVTDYEGVFTEKEKAILNEIITIYERKSSNEIAVVSVVSIDPYKSMADYSLALGNKWGVGKKNKNNGVIIVFGRKIRQVWIRVGDGLRSKLGNEEIKTIIDTKIIPEFRKEDYFTGIKNGIDAIIEKTG